jgi:ribosome-associated protein
MMINRDDLDIMPDLAIPLGELTFTSSRSSKPGGQHVNKVASRITLNFDVAGSPSLTDEQRRKISSKLQTRINKEGVLRVVSQKYRSQKANKEAAIERFITLLRIALSKARPRIKTKTPAAVKQKRLEDKKHRGRIKAERARKISADE